MATTGVSKLPLTGDPVIDALTNGTYWVLGPDRTLTWAVADQPGNDWHWNANGAGTMRTAMTRVLAEFAEVANIKFQYTNWYADLRGAPADIVLSATKNPAWFGMSNSTYARAYFPNEVMSDPDAGRFFGATYPNAAGDVVLNFISPEMLGSSYLPGSNGFFALLHEVGHALGLKHPHDDGGTPGHATFQQLGIDSADTQRLTMMSYDPATSFAAWQQWLGLPASAGYPETLMPLDVWALQSIYGPNTTTRAGNTLYELYNDDSIETSWDAGGTDTVSAAGSLFGWRIIGLDAAGLTLTLAVPADSTAMTGKYFFNIERFEGSQWDDSIVGTGGSNTIAGLYGDDLLRGGGGNDYVDGGPNFDVAQYLGQRASFNVGRSGANWAVTDRTGKEGADTLVQVERVQFADGWVALDTAPGQSANKAAIALRALLGPASLRDTEGTGAALYAFDKGMPLQDFIAAVVAQPQFTRLAGSASNADFVRFVYHNVVGAYPGPAEQAYYVNLLDTGQFTKASLGVLAATVDVNAQSVEVNGVVQGGLAFMPFDGA